MDCRAFFEELSRAYADNGLDFPYSYDGFYFGDFGPAKACPNPPIQFRASRNKNKCGLHPNLSDKKAANYQWYNPPINKAQKSRLFKDPRDMVYTLAWELSQRIGRLSEALHARMVLSADDHSCVRSYIARWGV